MTFVLDTGHTVQVHTTHLRRLRRRRELGVRSSVAPATGALERREARGIKTEVGVAEYEGG